MTNTTATYQRAIKTCLLASCFLFSYYFKSRVSAYLVLMFWCHSFNPPACLIRLPPSPIMPQRRSYSSLTCAVVGGICIRPRYFPFHNYTTFLLYSMSISKAPSTAWEMAIIAHRNRNINLLLMKMSISGLWCWICKEGVDCAAIVN